MTMTLRHWATLALIAIGVCVLGYMRLGIARGDMHMQMENTASQGANPAGTFDSKHVGLHFDYPGGYAQALNHINEDQPDEYHQTVFVQGATTTGVAGSNLLPNITISGIDLDATTDLSGWMHSDPRSMYSLSGGVIAQATVGGEPALAYSYTKDGYTHQVYSVEDQGRMFVFDGSYKSPNDQIKKDFDAIIGKVTFLTPPNAY